MENLFNRAAVFTDLHFGKKNNDKIHNIDCVKFVEWFIGIAKERNVDCILFLGDWNDNRNSLQISTLNYSVTALELLNEVGIPVYFIPGNHDLFYKEKRDLSSVVIARNLSNITIFNEITQIGNVTFCPWLVSDEWKTIPSLANESIYVFGHFELPLFLMNAMSEMPENNQLGYHHFNGVDQWAFTGHFHKRQSKGKVIYMGNAFPHNYSDVWDDERGMMILDWCKTPEFIKWPNAPSYRTFSLSELLENPEESLNELIYARVNSDLDITHDQAQLIRDIFQVHYMPRKIEISSTAKTTEELAFEDGYVIKTVDQIVVEGLNNIDSVHLDKNILIQIYQNL